MGCHTHIQQDIVHELSNLAGRGRPCFTKIVAFIEPRILTNGISVGIQFLNYFVITLCLMSLILCLRAIVRAQFLKYRAKRFFKERFGWDMTTKEKLLFLNGWYIVICVNDILIIIGSVIKEMIESRNTYGDLWDFCALFLGLGNLLVWLGMLRYLGFFENYNILILTLKGAMPNIMRFIVCTSLIYMGFVFCGWAILGPYHFKFESIMSTSECLFSLINGMKLNVMQPINVKHHYDSFPSLL